MWIIQTYLFRGTPTLTWNIAGAAAHHKNRTATTDRWSWYWYPLSSVDAIYFPFSPLRKKKKLLTKLATRVEASGATEWILCRKECYVSVGWNGILSTDWSCLERVRTDIFSRSLILYSSLRDGPRFIGFHHNVRVENSVAIQTRDYPALLRILSLMVHGNIPSFLSFSSRTK